MSALIQLAYSYQTENENTYNTRTARLISSKAIETGKKTDTLSYTSFCFIHICLKLASFLECLLFISRSKANLLFEMSVSLSVILQRYITFVKLSIVFPLSNNENKTDSEI